MNIRIGLALVSLVSTIACVGQPDAPVTPSRTPFPSAVPGDTAHQWDPCDHEGDVGHTCTQACSNGGEVHGRFECVFSTWRCIVLSTSPCSNPNPQPPPSTPPDTTTPPASHPQGHVSVTCSGPERREVLTGSNDVIGRTMGIRAEGRPVVIRRQHLRFGDSMTTLSGFVQGRGGMPYFSNFRAQDLDTGVTVMGPATLRVSSDRREGDLLLLQNREVRVEAGERHVLAYRYDVATHEEVYHEMTSRRFTLRLDPDSSRAIFLGDDLVWGDTRESVSAMDVTYDASCFDPPARDDIQISPRYASLVVDVDRSNFASAGVVVSDLTRGERFPLVPLAVDNDGREDGLFDGMDVDVFVRTSGTISVAFDQIATVCMVTTMNGMQTFGSAVPNGNRVVFRGLGARIGAVSRARLMVRCLYQWPAGIEGNSIEVRAGVNWTSFTMVSLDDQGEIRGTSGLQDNASPSNGTAVTVTLNR